MEDVSVKLQIDGANITTHPVFGDDIKLKITTETDQIFHLHENRLISVRREDKAGHPVERHLIQGFTLPLGETGAMSINAVSVNDFPQISVTASTDFTGGNT